MSNVLIQEKALDTAIRHAQSSPDNEIIGVLVGRQKGNDLVITDAVPSQHGHADNVSVSLLNEFQAMVAEKLMREGSTDYIVGIYHSHPGFGCFFSDTDTATQMRIQQMFPQAVALVIDPFQKGGGIDYRFYRVENGQPVELRTSLGGRRSSPQPAMSPVAAQVHTISTPTASPPTAGSTSRIIMYLAIAALILSLCAIVIAGLTFMKVSEERAHINTTQSDNSAYNNPIEPTVKPTVESFQKNPPTPRPSITQ